MWINPTLANGVAVGLSRPLRVRHGGSIIVVAVSTTATATIAVPVTVPIPAAAVASVRTAFAVTATATGVTTAAAGITATATTAISTPVTTTTTTTTAVAALTGTGFVDGQATALKVLAIKAFDRLHGFGVVFHFHETETAAAASFPVAQNLGRDDFAVSLEQSLKILRCGRIRQVPNVKSLRHRVHAPPGRLSYESC